MGCMIGRWALGVRTRIEIERSSSRLGLRSRRAARRFGRRLRSGRHHSSPLVQEEEVIGDERCADGDCAVRYVEDRPEVDVNEVGDLAETKAVNQVADGAAERHGEAAQQPDAGWL